MGLAYDQFRERDFAAPDRIDAQTGIDFVRRKERLGAGRLVAADDQPLDGGAHGKPLNGEAANFGLAAGGRVDAPDEEAANERIARTSAEKNDQSDEDKRDFSPEDPGHVTQPSPFSAYGATAHRPVSSSILV